MSQETSGGCGTKVVIALIGAAGAIIAALITAGFFGSPSPGHPSGTPTATTVPHLSSSYSGTLTRVDGATYPLEIENVQEDNQGNFTANGTIGTCSTNLKGHIGSDNKMAVQAASCDSETFTGQLASDGSIQGTWQGQTQGMNGTWTAS